MIEFRYRAVDKLNQPVEGTVRAPTAAVVVKQLAEQGLQVSSVEPVEVPSGAYVPKEIPKGLRADHLVLFNEQLHAIVKGGLPLGPSLEALAKDVHSKRLQRAVEAVRADVEAGHSLSEALSRQPKAFPPVYVSMVRAGEQSGNLAAALEVLLAYSEQGLEFRYRLQEAVAYPLLVIVAAFAVLSLFSGSGGPDLATLSDQPTPRAVAGILAFSRFGWWVVAVFLVVASVTWLALPAIGGRGLRDTVKLYLPWYGRLLRDMTLARFSRSLSILLTARVPLSDGVRLAGVASGNAVLEEKTLHVADNIEAGRPMSNSLEETRFFPETYCWLVRTGETRGDLDRVLLEVAEGHERAAARRSRILATTAGPALTVVAAFIVVLVLMAIYRPLLTAMFGV